MRRYKAQGTRAQDPFIKTFFLVPCTLCLIFFSFGCNIYKFNQASIPSDIKTIRVQFIRNEARYQGNTQLSQQLTEKIRQKIISQTRLTQVASDTADYDISGFISQYDVSTSGISSQQVATNRLTVAVNITLLDRKTPNQEPKNFTVSRSFDFSANLTLSQAEQKLNDEMIRNLVDEIFNQIFSDW